MNRYRSPSGVVEVHSGRDVDRHITFDAQGNQLSCIEVGHVDYRVVPGPVVDRHMTFDAEGNQLSCIEYGHMA